MKKPIDITGRRFGISQETIDAAIEQDKQIAAFIAQKLGIESKEG